jgi:hypothetical protein
MTSATKLDVLDLYAEIRRLPKPAQPKDGFLVLKQLDIKDIIEVKGRVGGYIVTIALADAQPPVPKRDERLPAAPEQPPPITYRSKFSTRVASDHNGRPITVRDIARAFQERGRISVRLVKEALNCSHHHSSNALKACLKLDVLVEIGQGKYKLNKEALKALEVQQ